MPPLDINTTRGQKGGAAKNTRAERDVRWKLFARDWSSTRSTMRRYCTTMALKSDCVLIEIRGTTRRQDAVNRRDAASALALTKQKIARNRESPASTAIKPTGPSKEAPIEHSRPICRRRRTKERPCLLKRRLYAMRTQAAADRSPSQFINGRVHTGTGLEKGTIARNDCFHKEKRWEINVLRDGSKRPKIR